MMRQTDYRRNQRLRWIAITVLAISLSGCATMDPEWEAKMTEAETARNVSARTASLEKGNAALQREDWTEARFHYSELLKKDAEHHEALVGLARVFQGQGALGEAHRLFSRALAIQPEDAMVLTERGITRIRLNQHDDARSDLRRAASLGEQNWRAINALGVIADIRGKHSLAQHYYERASDQSPGNTTVRNNLGYSLIMSGDLRQAQSVLSGVLAIDPAFTRARNNLAIALARQGHYDDAVAVIRRGGQHANAYNNVGYLALLRGDLNTAENYFLRAIEMQPTYHIRAATNLRRAHEMSERNKRENSDTEVE